MKKQLRTFLTMLGLCSTLMASSQTDSVPRSINLVLGGALNKTSVNETLNTSLSYSGTTPGFSVDFNATTRKMYFSLRNTYSGGYISPYKATRDMTNRMQSFYVNVNASTQWLLFSKPENKLFTYLGPMISGKLGARIKDSEVGNSGLTYNLALSAGVAAKVDKYVTIDHFFSRPIKEQNFKLGFEISCPLLSKVWAQSYAGMPETLVQENGGFIEKNCNYTGYFSNYTNIQMDLSLAYILRNKNAIGISYLFDFSSINPKVNPSKTMNQMVGLKLHYNFK